MLRPFQRPDRTPQVGALCLRARKGGAQVLLITSRDTGRWIIPKGWPMDGLSDARAAQQEAWEEAGVREGRVSAAPVGSFPYDKRKSDNRVIPVDVAVYRIEVDAMADDFPEANERTRRWVSPTQAAEMVDEPELAALLRGLEGQGPNA
ncbi:NUDIX hydrolase [Sulfitobacter albidus]|uniref:NUDIX hydrolase n=1 Tax=Sulfitobacter albidus TaxID=2829501 RepID=UPI0020C89AF6|nr:NUDIX hydrolase [Sulfitobacter albidus]